MALKFSASAETVGAGFGGPQTDRAVSARRALLATSMLTSVIALGVPAATAQESAERSEPTEVMVVTAQRREENIQDVPISLIALGTEKLEELEVSSFEDYARFLPSVTFQSTGPNSTSVYFRGVVSGGDGNHSASLPSVGVYLDEQPVTTILGFLPVHIYDIERVEALAGPQGTLFGASSQSGTLRIITNKPKLGETEGAIDLEVNDISGGETGYQFEGFFNAPISDRAAIRLVGFYRRDGGYIDNVADSRTFPSSGITKTNADIVEGDFNDVETFGARVALKIDLNENWTATPTLLGQKTIIDGRSAYDPQLGDLNVGRFVEEKNEDRFFQAALTVEGKVGNFDVVYAGAYLKRQIDSLSDYTDYAYYYDVLYGSGAYFYDDLGNLIDPSQTYEGDDSFSKYSNEIRIASPSDRRLRVQAGFFQNRQTHFIHQQYEVIGLADAISVTDHPDTIWLTEQKRVDRDLAIFGEVSFDITDRLTFTGGVRGYRYRNSLQGFFGYSAGFSSRTGEAACFGPAIVPDSPCTNLDREVKDTGETHKLNLSYDIDDDKMIYFTYSTGFRPGGVNRRGTLPPYLADELVNYEFGFKTGWFDNSVIFNAAFFRQRWNDFQFPILGENGLTEIQNAAQARIQGIEADMTWAAAEGLTINGAVAIIDAKLTEQFCGEFDPATGGPLTECDVSLQRSIDEGLDLAPDGARLPVVPEFKGTLTARYEFPLGPYDAHLQSSVSGQTSAPSSFLLRDQFVLGQQQGFVQVDFNFGIKKDTWEIVGYVNNAFDERPDLNRFVACGISVCGARVQLGTTFPRTYGIRLGKEF